MKPLFISEAKLDDRRKKLPERFKRYLPDAPYFTASFQDVGQYTKIIGIHQGNNREVYYKSWRVSLSSKQMALGYYEVWEYVKQKGMPAKYLLNKVNLHVYLPHPAGDEKPLVYLHCEPQESETSEHFKYKVGPHTHFEISGDPWNKVHVPLCDGRQDDVLRSVKSLDEAFERGVQFVVEELCPITGKLDLYKFFEK